VVFYSVWTVFELALRPPLVGWLGSQPEALTHVIVVKTVIWLLPAVLLMRRFRLGLRVSIREMLTATPKWVAAFIVFAVFTAWVVSAAVPDWAAQGFHLTFPLIGVVRSAFAGVQEEVVFRGWLANAMPNWANWRGYLVNGLLFALIHVPAWIKNPSQVDGWLLLQAPLALTLFGAVLAWLFAKSRSLVVPIVIHTWYDLLVAIVPGG
jgi:membrane protease YdiL (CAAX protease family)